jgi:hypothetical protein
MASMQRSVRAAAMACAAIAFAFVWSTRDAGPALAQSAPAKPKVDVSYEEPKDARLAPIVERLKQRQVLQRLQQFLAPLKLKRDLVVKTADCGDRYYLPYKPGEPVTICYQFVRLIETAAPEQGSRVFFGPTLVTREMALVGPFVQEVLHNVALAVFDIQGIPVWGNAEFAADNVSAFLMLQFGTDVAMKTILGTAYFLNRLENTSKYTVAYLGDVRPTVRQRYYNVLCVAYGSDPVKFGIFRAINRQALVTDLPERRARSCEWVEYDRLYRAFKKVVIEPHVDPELQKQVLAGKWID